MVAKASSYPSTNIVDLSPYGSTVSTNSGLSVVDGAGLSPPQDEGAFYLDPNETFLLSTDVLGTEDFTIEMYIRRDGTHSNRPKVWGTENSNNVGDGHIAGNISSSGEMVSHNSGSRVEDDDTGLTTPSVPSLEFFHYALCREGGVLSVFINGQRKVRDTSSTLRNDTSGKFVIGPGQQSLVPLWFNSIRITKGVARYSEDFTPPTAPFPQN